MSALPPIEFPGTDEEAEKYLLEFARAAGGWAARDPRRGGWVVGGGALLSTNPNTLAWRIRVRRESSRLVLAGSSPAFPGTRAKASRITAYRQGQLADFIELRLRGGGPEKSDPRRLREPFAPFGSGPAALTASFAWTAASGAAAFLLSWAALAGASFFLLSVTIGEISDRAALVEAAGALPLPSRAELDSIGFSFKLAAALVFAFPVAFLFGAIHGAALAGSELWRPLARLGQASFLFQAALLTLALSPFLTVFAAVPLALLAPAAAHQGYLLVWGRRRERVREGKPPRPAVVAAGAILAAGLAGFLLPRAASGDEINDRMALFRDRYMLGNALGKAAARVYYRYTLYAADPLKQFFAADRETPQRSLRTARLMSPEPGVEARFRELDFAMARAARERADVAWDGKTLVSGDRSVPWSAQELDRLPAALDRLARESFRGGSLRELYGLAWRSLYFLGPVVLMLLLIGACCPAVSMLYRVLPVKAATLALGACFLVTVVLLAAAASGQAELRAALEGPLEARLSNPSWAIRHEAAYRAFKNPSPGLAGALLVAAGDPDFRVRLWACAALGKTRHPAALETLLERLRDPEFFVRYRAAEGLGFLGNGGAAGALRDMMARGSWYEGLYALQALRRIGPREH